MQQKRASAIGDEDRKTRQNQTLYFGVLSKASVLEVGILISPELMRAECGGWRRGEVEPAAAPATEGEEKQEEETKRKIGMKIVAGLADRQSR